MPYYFILTRKVIMKKIITNIGEDVEKLEPSLTVGRNVKWYSCLGKQSGSSSKG